MSDSSLIEVTKGCRKLHTLKFEDCEGLSDATLAQIFTYCTKLAHLDLFKCIKITGKCLENGVTAALRRLCIDVFPVCVKMSFKFFYTFFNMCPSKCPFDFFWKQTIFKIKCAVLFFQKIK